MKRQIVNIKTGKIEELDISQEEVDQFTGGVRPPKPVEKSMEEKINDIMTRLDNIERGKP